MDRRKSPARAGFTLIEVLVAVLIIATLVAILLPAVRGAFRRAQEAQITAELNNLATALASFKNTFGDFPPSRVILCEGGYNVAFPPGSAILNSTVGDPTTTTATYHEVPLADANCTDITMAQLIQRSRLYMRRFWPRVDFDSGSVAFDFNNNGTPNEILTLSGSECLTFFLGGQPSNASGTTSGPFGLIGFNKLPTNPFPYTPSTSTAPTNRTVSNYDFNVGRLVDLDGDGIPSYLDPLNTIPGSQRAYAYFSSYGTNSYDPNDVNGYGHNDGFEIDPNDPNLTTVCEWGFTVAFPESSSASGFAGAVSPSPNPYTTGASGVSSVNWANPNSFQIISPGVDGIFGYGGAFIQGSTAAAGPLPVSSGLPGGEINTYSGSGVIINRVFENDNLTNFSSGRLN